MCPLSIIRCALSPFVHVFTLQGVFFSLSNVCTLSIVSTVCTVHCALCPLVQVFIACFVFSLSCVSVVCVMCSGIQVVVVCVFPSCAVCPGVFLCVFRMLFCYCMCVCAACEKQSFFPLQEIYIKKCIFLKNNYCFSCVYGKKAVPLQCENEGDAPLSKRARIRHKSQHIQIVL